MVRRVGFNEGETPGQGMVRRQPRSAPRRARWVPVLLLLAALALVAAAFMEELEWPELPETIFASDPPAPATPEPGRPTAGSAAGARQVP
ncbi:MAG TPA: hypothetical protein VFR34_00690 [Paracoccaceae bacterium]|nr:hypothetical protein [Paracoccaceae bacterium]